MSLKESARQWVLKNLPYDKNNINAVTHLSGLDASELLALYRNWIDRLIKPQPRQVFNSQAFAQNPIVKQNIANFNQIVKDIEGGSDLKKYLSNRVDIVLHVPTKKQKFPAHLDLMLNEWGIHHLHISTQIEADGFVSRDGPLLFAVFKPEKAYLIDVMGHNDWTSHHLLEVLIDTWPNDGVIHQIKNAIGVGHDISEQDRKVLRGKHCNSTFKYKKKVYMPNGGMTGSGLSLASVRSTHILIDCLERFETDHLNNPSWLKEMCLAQGVNLPDEPEFEFAIQEDGYGVIETKSKTWFNLQP